jgi:hypothetical protein
MSPWRTELLNKMGEVKLHDVNLQHEAGAGGYCEEQVIQLVVNPRLLR